jgi:hypothetical protein
VRDREVLGQELCTHLNSDRCAGCPISAESFVNTKWRHCPRCKCEIKEVVEVRQGAKKFVALPQEERVEASSELSWYCENMALRAPGVPESNSEKIDPYEYKFNSTTNKTLTRFRSFEPGEHFVDRFEHGEKLRNLRVHDRRRAQFRGSRGSRRGCSGSTVAA